MAVDVTVYINRRMYVSIGLLNINVDRHLELSKKSFINLFDIFVKFYFFSFFLHSE